MAQVEFRNYTLGASQSRESPSWKAVVVGFFHLKSKGAVIGLLFESHRFDMYDLGSDIEFMKFAPPVL
jgi:hypothetical protein